MTAEENPVILVAEDNQSVAEGYELWLGDDYEIHLTTDGQEALDAVNETVDVVILDRMMPKLSGKAVLQGIRDQELDCQVAMVTAVEADFDVIEMGFDAYVTKPPERAELIETIEQLLERKEASDAFQEYYSLMARKGALQARKTPSELAENEAYQELLDRIEAKRAAVDGSLGDLDEEIEFVSAVRKLESDDEPNEADGLLADSDLDDGFEDIELDEELPFEGEER